MVIGMLLAGGIGQRMGADVPKQFLQVGGKPIVCYPLDIMEKHSEIDEIEIVCVRDFIDDMWGIVKRCGYRKVKWITSGGATCQESTWKGLKNLKGRMSEEDIVLIHMTSYPLASAESMSECIASAKKNGNGCTARPVLCSAYFTDDHRTSTKQIDRDKLMLCTIPYAFHFGECLELYEKAYREKKGVDGNVFTNTLYCDYGKRIYFTKDSDWNLKITAPNDIKLLEAYLKLKEQNS